MTSPALRLAVALLTLFFLVAVGASVANQTAPNPYAVQSAGDIGYLDCPLAESAPGHTHCPSAAYASVEIDQSSSPLAPTSGSGVWSDAVATHNSTTTHLRLFRPPKFFRAQV